MSELDMVERVRDAIVSNLKAQAAEQESRYVGEMTIRGNIQLDGYFLADAIARAAIEAMRAPPDTFAAYLQLAHDLRPQDWSELISAALTPTDA